MGRMRDRWPAATPPPFRQAEMPAAARYNRSSVAPARRQPQLRALAKLVGRDLFRGTCAADSRRQFTDGKLFRRAKQQRFNYSGQGHGRIVLCADRVLNRVGDSVRLLVDLIDLATLNE